MSLIIFFRQHVAKTRQQTETDEEQHGTNCSDIDSLLCMHNNCCSLGPTRQKSQMEWPKRTASKRPGLSLSRLGLYQGAWRL